MAKSAKKSLKKFASKAIKKKQSIKIIGGSDVGNGCVTEKGTEVVFSKPP